MRRSVTVARMAGTRKRFSSTRRRDRSIHRIQREPERQLDSLRGVIGDIRNDGGMPSVESIATQMSGMRVGACAPVISGLQQTHGNRYVQRVVSGIQAKLKVGQPGDKYEQEADRVAEQVLRMPEPGVQRQPEEEEEEETLHAKPLAGEITPRVQRQVEPEEEEEEEEELIQTKALSEQTTPLVQRQEEAEEEEEIQTKPLPSQTSEVVSDVETSINSIRGGGQPLPGSNRAFFEPRFGQDFSQVRLHTDARAADAARAVNAKAFTMGRNVVFGAGQYAPETYAGKKLLAHELTHVVQQGTVRSPAIQRANCTSKTDRTQVVKSHTVTPNTIEKPGDKVEISVEFNCNVRSWNSKIETKTGVSLGLRKPFTKRTNKFKRIWNGKKYFTKVGTYIVDDGEYRHRLSELLYAYKYNPKTGSSKNMYATTKLVSPSIKIKTRAYTGIGAHHPHHTTQNVNDLAQIITSEMSIGNSTEQNAIAWAVRNQMIRMNVASVANARDRFSDAHDQSATPSTKKIAEAILKKKMSNDITSGAIKWFSPRKMPKKGGSCKNYDCSGGLITVTDIQGNRQKVYAPGFHKTMTYVSLSSVREWFLRLYRL